ncbi:MAG: hypothetical protein ICV84_16765 [Flavisolibacter sp.]|nr:hypothetical protein [Flavisolibacter sp.]
MKFFLDDLKNYCNYYNPSDEKLQDFLSSYQKPESSELSYFIILAEQNGGKTIFKDYMYPDPWPSVSSPFLEKVYAIGTGYMDYFDSAEMTYNIILDFGHGKRFYEAMFNNLMPLSESLASERLTLQTIQKRWGAGFEMIVFDEDKFIKIDDLTYVIWKINLHEDGTFIGSPLLIMHYKYFNDVLVITSFDHEKPERYGVLPVYMQRDDPALCEIASVVRSGMNIEPQKLACYFLVESHDQRFCLFSVFQEKWPGKDSTINAQINEGQLEIKIDRGFFQHIINRAKIKFDVWRKAI